VPGRPKPGQDGRLSSTWRARPLTNSSTSLPLLVIPLANVVLAAVPREVASGAGGIFSTAQQLGGAVGVAVIGTLFFGSVEHHTFTQAFEHAAPVVIGLFVVAGLLSPVLPDTAVSEDELVEV